MLVQLDELTVVDANAIEMMQVDVINGQITMYRLTLTSIGSAAQIISTEKDTLLGYMKKVQNARAN